MRLKERVFLFFTVAEDVPQYIETDYQRLKQVLINLLRNSTKFTFSGYIVIRVTKSKLAISKDSRLLALADAVQFEVYDTGIGIN
jgi:two-component system, sensor histidine kinase and response regulator